MHKRSTTTNKWNIVPFPSGCLAAQTKRWAEGIRVPAPLAGGAYVFFSVTQLKILHQIYWDMIYIQLNSPISVGVVQSLKLWWLFATLWTAALQASLSFTVSWSLLKLMSIESVMLFNHLILCCPLFLCLQSFPASGSFPVSRLFESDDQAIRASASASVFPMNIQSWFPLGWTGLIPLKYSQSLLQHHNSKV